MAPCPCMAWKASKLVSFRPVYHEHLCGLGFSHLLVRLASHVDYFTWPAYPGRILCIIIFGVPFTGSHRV